MKKIAKLLCLVLALSMIFVFAGCGEKADETSSNTSTVSSEDENKNTNSAVDAEGNPNSDANTDAEENTNSDANSNTSTVTKDEVATVTEGKLTMATNAYFQPYEFYEGDKIVGIDAEIAAAIAEKLGLELVIEDMAFDSIITAVSAGKADFGLAGMTITEERLKSVDFSVSYAKGVQSIIVKEGSEIKSVDDLYKDGASYKIGTQLGTTGYIYATDDFGEKLVTPYTTGNEAVTALLGGDVDCVIIDNEPAKSFVKNNAGLAILDTSYADEDYAACVAKGNTALLDAIDGAIVDLTADGTIQKIVDKYIK